MNERAGRFKSVWALVDGLRIHARVATQVHSEALPLVLVHGLVVSSRYMLPLAELLAERLPVYLPDLPGFGKSEHPARPLDIPGLAGALASWMHALGIERAALIGNSLGCQVIADLALHHPSLVDRAVLIGPTMDRQGRTLMEQTRRLVAAMPYEALSLLAVQLRDMLSSGPREALSTARYALADRPETKLPALQIPVLVVSGAQDPIAPPRWAAELARLAPRGQLHVVPGGHALNYSAPEQILAAVALFLDRPAETKVDDALASKLAPRAAPHCSWPGDDSV